MTPEQMLQFTVQAIVQATQEANAHVHQAAWQQAASAAGSGQVWGAPPGFNSSDDGATYQKSYHRGEITGRNVKLGKFSGSVEKWEDFVLSFRCAVRRQNLDIHLHMMEVERMWEGYGE